MLTTNFEPSRSVLCRSAATLFLSAGKLNEAEQMAALGLSGDGVPDEIAAELREVLRDCWGESVAVREIKP